MAPLGTAVLSAIQEPSDALQDPLHARFAGLFAGRASAFGYSFAERLGTERAPLTRGQYERHLTSDGQPTAWSLGLNPLRDDNTVTFGALDFDARDLPRAEAEELIRRAGQLGLPLMWTMSKSGGLHAWVFLTSPTDPQALRDALRSWGTALGWTEKVGGDSKDRGDRFFEVFPKQVQLMPGQPGNWIRLPWPGGDHAQSRRGLAASGANTTLHDWLTLAEGSRVTPATIARAAAVLGAEAQRERSTEESDGRPRSRGTDRTPRASTPKAATDDRASIADVRRWLGALGQERCDEYETWVKVLMALHHEFSGSPDEAAAIAAAVDWSARSGKYANGDVEEKWQSFGRTGNSAEITIRSLAAWAGLDAESNAIEETNRHYAHVLKGGGAILFTPKSGEPEFFETRRWKEHHGNKQVAVGENKRKKLSDAWLDHPNRRSYHTVIYEPNEKPYAGVPSRSGPLGTEDFNSGQACTSHRQRAGRAIGFLRISAKSCVAVMPN